MIINLTALPILNSTKEQKSYVVAGAILSCSYGSMKSRLEIPFSHGVYLHGQAQMNVMDHVPHVNIMPFGRCSSLSNPIVASATAANMGILTPMPCNPVVTTPWIEGKTDKLVENFPALLNTSTNLCSYCGFIKIEDDGQKLGSASKEEDSFFSPLVEFTKGAGDAASADFFMGIVENKSYSKHPIAYKSGEIFGHTVATVAGFWETVGAVTVGAGGGALTISGGGAVVGVPAVAAASAVASHGTMMTQQGASNALQSAQELASLFSAKGGKGNFNPNDSGYFGSPGKGGSHTRNLTGGNNAAKKFFEEISVGATTVEKKGKVTIANMPDGQRIVYRSTSSSDGTPVVEIHGIGKLKPQKIHFGD